MNVPESGGTFRMELPTNPVGRDPSCSSPEGLSVVNERGSESLMGKPRVL
jgi:hypothetical protein